MLKMTFCPDIVIVIVTVCDSEQAGCLNKLPQCLIIATVHVQFLGLWVNNTTVLNNNVWKTIFSLARANILFFIGESCFIPLISTYYLPNILYVVSATEQEMNGVHFMIHSKYS